MSQDPAGDFDFILGDWDVAHRRLRSRLTGCTEWDLFAGVTSTRKILGGQGNIEDNLIEIPSGHYRAAALRTFDTVDRVWSIWWLDGRFPRQLGVPVVGGFSGDLGLFYADEVLNDQPIRVRFTWRKSVHGCPQWEQAFSADAGQTWETNWTMVFRSREPNTAGSLGITGCPV